MATAPNNPPPPAARRELVIVSHSNLFYWWPVWLTGFILAGVTYMKDVHMALVPAHTQLVDVKKATFVDRAGKPVVREEGEAIIGPEKAKFPRTRLNAQGEPTYFAPWMHPSPGLALLFLLILLLVITITNVAMRGLWSVIVIIVILLGSIIMAQLGLWDVILNRFRYLALHINMAGYLFFSTVLFIIWLVNFLFFDQQIYVIFTPGQFRVRQEIGGGEIAYDTVGISFHKQRSDLFRHWILGFGSGDLVIRPGQSKEPIELHNVLNVGRRVREIEKLLQEREIVASPR